MTDNDDLGELRQRYTAAWWGIDQDAVERLRRTMYDGADCDPEGVTLPVEPSPQEVAERRAVKLANLSALVRLAWTPDRGAGA